MAGNVEFTVEIKGDRELMLKITELPSRLRQALVRATAILAANLERSVKAGHLSGPTGAHSLSIRSGNLMSSVHQLPIQQNDSQVTGGVAYGATVAYAAIHEFGGTINVPEMIPVNAKALHFMVGGADVFAMRTRAHSVKMPERAPLRTAFKDMQQEIIDTYKAAADKALHE